MERPPIPDWDRAQHGSALLRQIEALEPIAQRARAEQQACGLETGFGLTIAFESFPDIELAFERLSRDRSGIELLNVRHIGDQTIATVFVPDGNRTW
jgi:hypothetical protein